MMKKIFLIITCILFLIIPCGNILLLLFSISTSSSSTLSQQQSKFILEVNDDNVTKTNNNDDNNNNEVVVNQLNSVEYLSCCGLGHRLVRMSCAYHVAKYKYQFVLRTFWGWCSNNNHTLNNNNNNSNNNSNTNNTTNTDEEIIHEIYSKLFYVENISYLLSTTTTKTKNQRIQYFNEVNGYKSLRRIIADQKKMTNKNKGTSNGNLIITSSTTNNSIFINNERQLNNLDSTNNKMEIVHNDNYYCSVCEKSKVTSDYVFYNSLRNRFQYQQTIIQPFLQYHQYNTNNQNRPITISIHVRAGNNETGDFSNKQRGIPVNQSLWVYNVLQEIQNYIQPILRNEEKKNNNDYNNNLPPLLFIATDTPNIINLFRYHVQKQQQEQQQSLSKNKNNHDDYNIPILEVIEYQNQIRPKSGVLFGIAGKLANKYASTTNQCMKQWVDAISDMILLSYANIVIAGRPSSFVQTLPMSIALHPFNTNQTYCEIYDTYEDNNHEHKKIVQKMKCYKTYEEWCCAVDDKNKNHNTNHTLRKKSSISILSYKENVQFPDPLNIFPPPKLLNRTNPCLAQPGMKKKQMCLSHTWKY